MLRSLFLLLTSLFLLLPSAVFAANYAVLVGVEQYEHPKLREPVPLKYPIEDVTELGDILKQSGYEVVLLTDDTGKTNRALRPTNANVDTQVKAVLRKCQKSDTVILAFAGHGLQFAGQNDAYFCPLDARPFSDEADSLVSISGIHRQLEKSFAGVKIIFIDACRNDPDPGRGRGLDADSAPPPPKGVGAIFSCSAGQRAFEHDDLKHGVFFDTLLSGMRSDARDRRGEVTFEGLALHVRREVPRRVAELFPMREQLPNLKADLVGIPPVLLSAIPQAVITNSIGMKLRLILAAEFMMGSPENELGREDDEHQHRVRISQPFYLQTTEVTQRQWESVMGTTPWQDDEFGLFREGSEYPAVSVRWNDTVEFCRKLSAKERLECRLPSEAEWEYACRAASRSAYSFGDNSTLKDYAWFGGNATAVNEEYAHRVGLKRPNDWGLYDMHGNVAEWCSDRYDSDYYKSSPLSDPRGPSFGSWRLVRGGSWDTRLESARSADRSSTSAGYRSCHVGFRVLRSSK